MADDGGRYLALLEELREAGRRMAEAIEVLDAACVRLAADVEDGMSVLTAYSAVGTGPRDSVFTAVARLEAVLNATRAEGIRIMVDEDGASLSEVARLIGRSRQFVTRLYRQAREDPGEVPAP